MTDKELCRLAVQAMDNSYSPYSGCKVGAALLCENGDVFTGCNIENAAFSPSICAERTAVFKAVSEGRRDFLKIAVAGGKGGTVTGVFAPCGVCRQVLREFCPDDFEILLVSGADEFERTTLAGLLPISFRPEEVL